MRPPRRLLAVLILGAAMVPGVAAAEWFVDAYAGGAFTQSATFKQETYTGTVSFPDLTFDTAPSFGIRGGRWFESLPWLGIEIDLSHFEPHRTSQAFSVGGITGTLRERDFKVSSLAVDLRLRWPMLTSEAYPGGQLQPYLSLGPAVFVTQTRLPAVQSSDDVVASPGAHAGAGVLWQLHPVVGVFAEYRFTYFHLDFKSGGVVQSDTDIATHHLLAGVSFRF